MYENLPLPFKLPVPEEDSVQLSGFSTVTYEIEGLIRVEDLMVVLEWTGKKTIEQLTFSKIGTDVEDLPNDWLELPAEDIASARVHGLFTSNLELVANSLDAFSDVPSAKGPRLRLKVRRRDRKHAKVMARVIMSAAQEARLLPAEEHDPLPTADADYDSQEYLG